MRNRRGTTASEPQRRKVRRPWKRRWEALSSQRPFWAGLLVLVIPTLFVLRHGGVWHPAYLDLQAGQIAPTDVKAPRQIEFEDVAATEAARKKARAAVLPVYDLNSRAGRDVLGAFRDGMAGMRRESEEWFSAIHGPAEGGEAPDRPHPLPMPARLEERSGELLPAIPEKLRAALYRHGYPEEVELWVAEAVDSAQRGRIAVSAEELRKLGRTIVRDVHTGQEREEAQPVRVRTLEEARSAILARSGELEGLEPRERETVADYAASLVTPNLSPNVSETERRRAEAEARVTQIVRAIPEGKNIVREGEEVTPEAVAALGQLASRRTSMVLWASTLAFAAMTGILVLFLRIFLRRYQPSAEVAVRPLFAMTSLSILVTFALAAAFLSIADSLYEVLRDTGTLHQDSLRYAIPWAAGAMALGLLADRQIAVAMALVFSMLVGIYLQGDFTMAAFCLLSSLGGVYAGSRFRRRTDAIRAGLRVGAVNMGLVLVVHAFTPWLHAGERSWLDYPLAFLGGILAIPFFHLFFTLLEHAFDILTEPRLQELGDISNPLLRELAIKAPGTYQHSLTVGALAEAAAEAIGLNPFFCRVGALYHDVGKLKKPEYFVENQRGGVNPHDKLAPSMSALILISHVKDGLQLTREAGVPRPIRDLIPQHHGTRIITYFYNKAKQQEDPERQPAEEKDFRYPGPRPQTRQAAIFMLADAAEASARTIESPNPARLKGMIRQVTNAITLDGQLDECELTFKEIGRIQEAFLKTLVSIRHGRVSYPGFEFEEEKRGRRGTVLRFQDKRQ